ncbi:transcriptional regulator [marine bacterium AO1-C]|nr:transcriptional regulator [marine bacterium AO1-C]
MNFEPRKKVEIIIEAVKLDTLIYQLEEIGVPGFTVVGNISGKGANGVLDHNCKAKVFENTYLFTVCTEAQAQQVLEYVEEILQYFSGACFVSDVSVLVTNKVKA